MAKNPSLGGRIGTVPAGKSDEAVRGLTPFERNQGTISFQLVQ